MYTVLSLVGGLLSFLGFCLVWYRLRCIDVQVGRLEAVSVFDSLTGLRAGRLFESECAILCRGPSPIAVLLIDLDDFRRFNDKGYREEGDRALKLAAQVLSEKLRRRADRLYRLHTAGDEFVAFFAVEGPREAYRQAERLRGALATVKVPCSVGIAFAEGSTARDPAQLLRLATTNKNVAKKRGGNGVFPPPEGPPPSPLAVRPTDWDKTERLVVGNLLPSGSR
jgi:diguanylate cyclase (GGDEF)-like protein